VAEPDRPRGLLALLGAALAFFEVEAGLFEADTLLRGTDLPRLAGVASGLAAGFAADLAATGDSGSRMVGRLAGASALTAAAYRHSQ
jgi:hypothetical protein